MRDAKGFFNGSLVNPSALYKTGDVVKLLKVLRHDYSITSNTNDISNLPVKYVMENSRGECELLNVLNAIIPNCYFQHCNKVA